MYLNLIIFYLDNNFLFSKIKSLNCSYKYNEVGDNWCHNNLCCHNDSNGTLMAHHRIYNSKQWLKAMTISKD